ncbi:hypothetical protein Patl1_07329 [Pistacia atlantica]|uniref:Uncharacterized protein n=1 Tax=Pistacia atlantica TaxID=434234 RepID=A0ACC1AFG7_9ROSI|nr:hypothetical protein Patl1_07329 [Pistacia atlantica]
MRDFVLDFEDLAEGLCWYIFGAFDFVAEEVIAFCLVLVSLFEDFIGILFIIVLCRGVTGFCMHIVEIMSLRIWLRCVLNGLPHSISGILRPWVKGLTVFLMEDGYVYFMIVDEGLGKLGALQFLEHLRDEFKKAAKKGSRGSFSGMNAIGVQEQLVPVIHRLITSLENVSQSSNAWNSELPLSDPMSLSPSPSNANGQIEVVNSTKAPLLGKSSKQDKKKAKDHIIAVRDVELEEHRNLQIKSRLIRELWILITKMGLVPQYHCRRIWVQ